MTHSCAVCFLVFHFSLVSDVLPSARELPLMAALSCLPSLESSARVFGEGKQLPPSPLVFYGVISKRRLVIDLGHG